METLNLACPVSPIKQRGLSAMTIFLARCLPEIKSSYIVMGEL
jgi:hypothetical protein